MNMDVLEVSRLSIAHAGSGAAIVPELSFCVKEKSCLAIVGESGSGKSIVCKAIMRLNGPALRQSGSIRFKGTELTELSDDRIRGLRGAQIGMILQNGMRAFDPGLRLGKQLHSVLKAHFGWSREESRERLSEAMELLLLQSPTTVLNRYPHELSGGMLQRLMIALKLVLQPELVIADEPTTALDAASRQEAIGQLISLRRQAGCSMILISHDLSAVERIADEVLVLRGGMAVERGTAAELLTSPRHAYTRYLVESKHALSGRFAQALGGRTHAER